MTECRDEALKVLSRRDYSVSELTTKILELGFEEDETEEAVTWLLSLGYLDDEKYARGILKRSAAKGYGAERCRLDLRRRGIPADVMWDVLEEYPDSAPVIDRLIERNVKDPELGFRERQRLTALLMRRGFAMDEIRDGLCRFGVGETD